MLFPHLNELNEPQRLAAGTTSGPLVLLAGAGTGKTRVITYRIANLLYLGVSPDQIVAMTFTNKAAREMRERISSLVGSSSKALFIGTFHAYCLNLLRRFHKQAGLPRRFSILGISDQIDLVQKCIDERNWSGRYRSYDIHARISRAKNLLVTPEEMATGSRDFHDEDPATLSVIYGMYQRQLALNHGIDFDDCIFRVVQLLRADESVRVLLHEELQQVLVDEYQDTNLAQLELLRLLTGPHNNICVVGDDDQSIYSWRGALAQNIDRFEELFPKSRLIRLEQNYRCSTVILNAANEVIKNNPQRKDKTLWSQNHSTDLIAVSSFDEEADEARWIARKCMAYLGRGFKASDLGILYRSNAQAKALEVAMLEHRLRYKVFGGQSFFERTEIKDFLGYLRVIEDPTNRMAFWRIVNTPARGVGLKTMERLAEFADEHNCSPLEALERSLEELPQKARVQCTSFLEHVKRLGQVHLTGPESLRTLAQDMIRSFRMEDHYRAKSSSTQSGNAKIDSLRRLPNWLEDIGSQLIEDEKALSLSNLIDTLALNDAPGKEEKEGQEAISLMTIHAAKGLEFGCVFLAGVEEGNLPHRNSLEEKAGVEEERRLFYVALTRAKKHLHLSYCGERKSGFSIEPRKPSRFLEELPEGVTLITDSEVDLAKDKEKSRQESLSTIRDLKAFFRKQT